MSITGQDQTADVVTADDTAPPIRGRFKLTPLDQGCVVTWASNLCDRCLDCGCGTQRQPLDLTPGGTMKTYKLLMGWWKKGVPSD